MNDSTLNIHKAYNLMISLIPHPSQKIEMNHILRNTPQAHVVKSLTIPLITDRNKLRKVSRSGEVRNMLEDL